MDGVEAELTALADDQETTDAADALLAEEDDTTTTEPGLELAEEAMETDLEKKEGRRGCQLPLGRISTITRFECFGSSELKPRPGVLGGLDRGLKSPWCRMAWSGATKLLVRIICRLETLSDHVIRTKRKLGWFISTPIGSADLPSKSLFIR